MRSGGQRRGVPANRGYATGAGPNRLKWLPFKPPLTLQHLAGDGPLGDGKIAGEILDEIRGSIEGHDGHPVAGVQLAHCHMGRLATRATTRRMLLLVSKSRITSSGCSS